MTARKDLHRKDKQLMDKYLNSMSVYLSALITVNGLVLTIFSARAVSPEHAPHPLTYVLLLYCVTSLLLLILNMRSIKSGYRWMAESELPEPPEKLLVQAESPEQVAEITQAFYDREIARADRAAADKQKWRDRRETVAETLLIFEGVLMIILMRLG